MPLPSSQESTTANAASAAFDAIDPVEAARQQERTIWLTTATGKASFHHGPRLAPLPHDGALLAGWMSGKARFGAGQANQTVFETSDIDIVFAKYSPDGSLRWAKRAGGSHLDIGTSVASSPNGSFALVGFFNFEARWAPQLNESCRLKSLAACDAFVARYTSAGGFLWVRQIAGLSPTKAHDVVILPDGSTVVVGTFQQEATLGPTDNPTTLRWHRQETGTFLARYDAKGDLRWARRTGFRRAAPEEAGAAPNNVEGRALALVGDDVLVVVGDYYGAALFAGSPNGNESLLRSRGQTDVFVAAYDLSGTVRWARTAGGKDFDSARDVAATHDGLVVVGRYGKNGSTFGSSEAPVRLDATGRDDLFVAKFAKDGSLEWARGAGGDGEDGAFGVGVLADGSAVVTGNFDQRAVFGRAESNPIDVKCRTVPREHRSNKDAFVARYTPTGSVAWVVTAGGQGMDRGNDVIPLSDGTVLVAGVFGSGADADRRAPVAAPDAETSFFLWKLKATTRR